MIKPHISIYLDTRRVKTDNQYPLKLRVFIKTGSQRIQKLYPLHMDLTSEEFEASYKAVKPRKEQKELKLKLNIIEQQAIAVADKLEPFSFIKFEKELFKDSIAVNDVVSHYQKYIDGLNKRGKVTTASSYDLSLKSLLAFSNSNDKRKAKKLDFEAITVDFLNSYERWILERGKSRTTVGIYLRPLRAIFNNAMEAGDIAKDLYPFGKRKYQIPAGRNIKKAINKEQLGLLFRFDTVSPEQIKARDFWFFSYSCNGMNVKDIAELKYSNLSNNTLIFSRAKTIDTTKGNHKPIVVPLSDFPVSIIKKYGNKDQSQHNYIFPILSKGMDPKQQDRAIKNSTRFLNQHIKNLAKAAGLTIDISTYWARHSFATNAIRSGASMEMIQESLGHNDLKTTMNYWGGFEESVKREIAGKLMDF